MIVSSHMMSKVRCRSCNHDWYEMHRKKLDKELVSCPNCGRKTPVKILIDFLHPAQKIKDRIGVHLVVQTNLSSSPKYNIALLDCLTDLGFIDRRNEKTVA